MNEELARDAVAGIEIAYTRQIENAVDTREAVIEELGQTVRQAEAALRTRAGEIARLGTRIDELQREIEDRQERIAVLESEVAEKEMGIAEQDERIAALNEEAVELRSELETLTGTLKDEGSAVVELREELQEKEREIERLSGETAGPAGLNRTIEEQEARIAELERELAGARSRPVTAETVRAARPGVTSADAERMADAAREEAFEAVLEAVALFTGESNAARRRRVESLVEEDPFYASVVSEIQQLAEIQADLAGALGERETKLIGTVATVTAGRVVIEPLVAVSIAEGARIIIKRRTSAGEIPIAEGAVYSVSAGRISARIENRISATRNPMVMDLVYVEL